MVLGAAAWWQGRQASSAGDALVAELVNDHLRVLARERSVDIESHGSHDVKPWFEGKLDFAPDVPSPAIPELQLRGGAVGYVFDQKAALVLYTLHRHAVTLVVRRADGPGSGRGDGAVDIHVRSARGFHVAGWKTGGLAYAVVSDVSPGELTALAARFAAATNPNGTR
jgi:anti-sigma factor RsiW